MRRKQAACWHERTPVSEQSSRRPAPIWNRSWSKSQHAQSLQIVPACGSPYSTAINSIQRKKLSTRSAAPSRRDCDLERATFRWPFACFPLQHGASHAILPESHWPAVTRHSAPAPAPRIFIRRNLSAHRYRLRQRYRRNSSASSAPSHRGHGLSRLRLGSARQFGELHRGGHQRHGSHRHLERKRRPRR